MSSARRDVPLAPFTTLGLGGPARELVDADTEGDLIDAVRDADAVGLPVLVLGGGSNLVVADEGFAGRVVRVGVRGVATEVAGDRALVRAAAGEPWDALVALAAARGWAGVEAISGVPGLVGATPIQNVGAYGQEVRDTITEVRLWDRTARAVVTFDSDRCGFAYRDSVFKRAARGRYVVLAVTFALTPGAAAPTAYAELARALAARGVARPTPADVREVVLALRRAKAMVLDPEDPDTRSVGSFFVNPVVPDAVADDVERRARAGGALEGAAAMPRFAAGAGRTKLSAGWLIERAGFPRGAGGEAVGVSRRHALALVHRGGGTTRALVALGGRIRAAVRATFGVVLEPEPVFAGFSVPDPLAVEG